MIFTNTISLILALAPATLFAAPARTVESLALDQVLRRSLSADVVKALEDGVCDLSKYKMPLDTTATPLPNPAQGLQLAHAAFGRGTQNYTCSTGSAKETPTQTGAVAQLFNVTCNAVRAPAILKDASALSLTHAIPNNDVSQRLLSGHHEFTAAGVPLFVLDSPNNNLGFVTAKKNASTDAPKDASKGTNGLGSVAWLRLTAVEGDFKEVFRLHTAGGVAPKTCEGINGAFQVEYSAVYFFWK